VLNWRVMWWSLPATTRRELLLRAGHASLEVHVAAGGIRSEWEVKYVFLGVPVCRRAFLLLTGLGASTCQEVRDAVLKGKVTHMSRAELGMSMRIANGPEQQMYLDARQWLEHYAGIHADMSPMKLEAFLPQGRKSFYYEQYRYERTSGATQSPDLIVASLGVFLKAWRVELPWIIVAKSQGMFTKCGLCEYLRSLIEQCPRTNQSCTSPSGPDWGNTTRSRRLSGWRRGGWRRLVRGLVAKCGS
jgi:hypothetical protein